jgi:heterodisulfide reductase subunit B
VNARKAELNLFAAKARASRRNNLLQAQRNVAKIKLQRHIEKKMNTKERMDRFNAIHEKWSKFDADYKTFHIHAKRLWADFGVEYSLKKMLARYNALHCVSSSGTHNVYGSLADRLVAYLRS